MPMFDIDGVSVNFPFEPYPVQRNYMKKVIESLTNSENAVLESPTGTGKTLSLLCAALAWIENEKQKQKQKKFIKGVDETEQQPAAPPLPRTIAEILNNVNSSVFDVSTNDSMKIPQVIYATRTHSQIKQAMKELKRSAYNHMKAGVVASRDQLCINPKLNDQPNADKIHMCRSLVKKNKCIYHCRVKEGLKNSEIRQNGILDIEDLGRIGKKLNSCPFYISKEIVKRADIIFMPYNYLLDPQIRKSTQINLKNAIIILDEGHNVEKVCEEGASTLIKSTQIDTAIGNADYAIITLRETAPINIDFTIDDIYSIKSSIEKLKQEVDQIPMDTNSVNTQNGSYIFTLLQRAGITEENHELTISLLEKIIGCMVELSSKKRKYVTGLRAVKDFLQIVFSSSAPNLRNEVNRCYKVYIERELSNLAGTTKTTVIPDKNAKIVNFWCFSPKFGMQYLLDQEIRCLILTSGTLAPLEALVSEMEISMPIRLKNPHIIEDFQVYVKIVGCGLDDKLLNSSYYNRNKKDYLCSLGNTILQFSKIVPDGLLVFFPSYILMNSTIQFWKANKIWSSIDKEKRIFVETQTKSEFVATMKDYYATINAPESKGAIFMAVMRGKVSEGLDFADIYGRAVIVTGIPFAPSKDAKVILKKQYLDNNKSRDKKMLSGNQWYVLDSIRAINQAIGRVIRHKNDFGGILFCDARFHEKQIQQDISDWIQRHLHNQNSKESFDSILQTLATFFITAKQRLPLCEPSVITVEEIEDVFESNNLSDNLPIITDSESSDSDEENGVGQSSSSQMQNSTNEMIESNGSRFKNQQRKRKLYSTDSDTYNKPNVASHRANPFGQIMEKDLGSEMYGELSNIVAKYNEDEDYESYRDALFEIFKEKCWAYNLKGMLMFTKPIHRGCFDNDINEFIRSCDFVMEQH